MTMLSAVSLARISFEVPTMLIPAGPAALNSTEDSPSTVSLAWAESVTAAVRAEATRPA